MKASQTHRELEFISPLGKDVLLLSQFNAKERLGRPFSIELTLRSTQENIDFEALLGQSAYGCFRFRRTPLQWHRQ